VIDGDGERRIIVAAGDGAAREPGVPTPASFASVPVRIAGMFLARAGRGVMDIKSSEGSSGREDFFRIRLQPSCSARQADTCGAENARAGIHDAEATDSDGRLLWSGTVWGWRCRHAPASKTVVPAAPETFCRR